MKPPAEKWGIWLCLMALIGLIIEAGAHGEVVEPPVPSKLVDGFKVRPRRHSFRTGFSLLAHQGVRLVTRTFPGAHNNTSLPKEARMKQHARFVDT